MRTRIVSSCLAILLFTSMPVAADDAAEIARLRQQLQQNLAALQTAAGAISQCVDPTNCDLRLWIAEQFVTDTLSKLLSNRAVTFVQTGVTNPPFLDGGDALGCGWYVNVGGLNARLAFGAVSALWLHSGGVPQLLLQPNFQFDAGVQVSGHINGPPGPCSLFRWSCDCPIGGGVGASVGVGASTSDMLPLIVSFAAAPQQLTVIVRQPQTKRLTVNASIGLGFLGAIRFPIPLDLPPADLYRQNVPLVFGTSGVLEVAGQRKPYTVDFTLQGPTSEKSGLALRSKVVVNWTQ